jgi:hypothetical protein
MKIEIVDASTLQKPDWHSSHILRPDLILLSSSIFQFGILSPLLVRESTGEIIDGYQRCRLVCDVQEIREKTNCQVPVVYISCDSLWARVLHIQINRGRGYILTEKLSKLVRELAASREFTEDDFDKLLTIKEDELEVLLDGTIIKRRKIAEHNYSRAWVPVEAPAGTVPKPPAIESPPNADR